MLEVCNITKIYHDLWKKTIACKNISFTVKEGEIASLLGLNGAGKSTIIKIISGLSNPTYGDVIIAGKSIKEFPLQAKKELAVLYENIPLYQEQTVLEFIMFYLQMKGAYQKEANRICASILDGMEIENIKDKKISTLSKGYKQRVSLALALSGEEHVIVLDEPTSNLDAKELKEFQKRVLQLDKTKAVLISTHNLELAQNICTKHILLNKGEIILQGNIEELKEALKEKLQDSENIEREKILELAFDVFGGVSKSDFYKN